MYILLLVYIQNVVYSNCTVRSSWFDAGTSTHNSIDRMAYIPGLASLLQNRPLVQTICSGCRWTRAKGAFVRIQRLAGWKGAPGFLWYSDLWSQLVPSTGPLYPLPPPPAQFNSAHLSFLLFLALVGGILAHLLTTFVKDLDFPAHPSALKVWGLFLSPFIDCVAHFML